MVLSKRAAAYPHGISPSNKFRLRSTSEASVCWLLEYHRRLFHQGTSAHVRASSHIRFLIFQRLLPKTMKLFDTNSSVILIELRTARNWMSSAGVGRNSNPLLVLQHVYNAKFAPRNNSSARTVVEIGKRSSLRPSDRATEWATERATERATAERSSERPSDRPSDWSVERSIDRITPITRAPELCLSR